MNQLIERRKRLFKSYLCNVERHSQCNGWLAMTIDGKRVPCECECHDQAKKDIDTPLKKVV